MSWIGEVQKQDVLFMPGIKSGLPDPLIPVDAGCCVCCSVFADLTDSSTHKNDFNTPIFFFPVIYDVVMTLEKDEAFIANLTDDTYGEWLGNLRVKNNERPVGYTIDWNIILGTFGTGDYRVRFDYGAGVIYSETYNLMHYSNDLADGSVRMEFTRSSLIGAPRQEVTRDFSGLEIKDQIRFCNANFGYKTAGFEVKQNRYEDGTLDSYEKNMVESYVFTAKRLDIQQHAVLLYDVLASDKILVCDYNSRNTSGAYVDVSVEVDGGYEPNYAAFSPSVVIKFKDAFDNRRKRYE